MRFDWDQAKNEANIRKHGISFEETKPLFQSGNYIYAFDEEHSDDEEYRYMIVGPVARGMIAVVYTDRNEGVCRIITARFAKEHEVKIYFEGGEL